MVGHRDTALLPTNMLNHLHTCPGMLATYDPCIGIYIFMGGAKVPIPPCLPFHHLISSFCYLFFQRCDVERKDWAI